MAVNPLLAGMLKSDVAWLGDDLFAVVPDMTMTRVDECRVFGALAPTTGSLVRARPAVADAVFCPRVELRVHLPVTVKLPRVSHSQETALVEHVE